MTTNVPCIVTPFSISVVLDSKTHVFTKAHPNFDRVREAVKAKDWDAIPTLVDIPKAINEFGKGKVEVRDGVVLYNNAPVHGVLTERILDMMGEGFDVNPMLRFMEKLMQNPSETSRNELYLFLEKANLPITDDGDFLAYKAVRMDYKDWHSGTFDNSVGKVCQMDRSKVDPNRFNLCSSGLHFCSLSYLPCFHAGNSRVVIVKINPADVVSIPNDYDNAKGRTWRYEVVGEHTDYDAVNNHVDKYDTSVVTGFHTESDDAKESLDTIEREVEGQTVKFKKDGFGEFVAIYKDKNGVEQEYDTLSDDIDNAVEEFKTNCTVDAWEFSVVLVALNDAAEVVTATKTMTVDANEVYDNTQEAAEEHVKDTAPEEFEDQDEFADIYSDAIRVKSATLVRKFTAFV